MLTRRSLYGYLLDALLAFALVTLVGACTNSPTAPSPAAQSTVVVPTAAPKAVASESPSSPTPRPVPTIAIGEVMAQPATTISPGQTVFLSLPISGGDPETPIKYEWSDRDGKGKIDPNDLGRSSIRYTAPTNPGNYPVDVKVTVGNAQVINKSALITVVSPPTPSPRATDTPTVTPTVVPTQTVTPSPVTPSPTARACPTSLPAIGRTGLAPVASVTIDGLRDCDTTSGFERYVTGTYSGMPDGTSLFVLVTDRKSNAQGNLYWIQPPNGNGGVGPADRRSDSEWGVHVDLGATEKWFDVVVVIADKTASSELAKWQATGLQAQAAHKANPFQGIPSSKLPSGIEEKARITVYRSD